MRPFEYQKTGIEFLAKRKQALLADEMGLGKTFQCIAAADQIDAKRILVMCPAVARINWAREIEKFSLLDRPEAFIKRKGTDSIKGHDIVIASYSMADSLVEELPTTEPFDVVILDEVHYLKSVDAKRTLLVMGKKGVIRHADRIWALSGTPAPNHIGEMWLLLYTFGITTLSYQKFLREFCVVYTRQGRDFVKASRVEKAPQVKAMLSNVMLRRKADEVLNLPPISNSLIYVEPSEVNIEEDAALVSWVIPSDRTAEFRQRLVEEENLLKSALNCTPERSDRTLTLQAISQSVSTLRRYTGLQKVPALVDLISQELEAKDCQKIVVFALHQGVIEGLRRGLRLFHPATIYGGTPPEKRQELIDRFQSSSKCRVFIGQINAAGVAITLTAANQVLFAECDWVPGNNLQALYRVRRIGQTKPIFARYAVIPNSIDEAVHDVLRRKNIELSKLFDEQENYDVVMHDHTK